MNRRTAHTTTKTTTRTGGEDAPRVPCAAYPHVYDAIGDPTHGDRGRAADEAREAARNLCATHLLRDPKAARACLSAAVANGERWALVVLDKPLTKRKQAAKKKRPDKTKLMGDYWAKFNAARAENLRELVANGAPLAEVCDRLGTNRKALYKWCREHGLSAEWDAINPKTEPVVTRAEATGRKRRVA